MRRRTLGKFTCGVGLVKKMLGNSADKFCHTRSVAYSVVLVLLNKHQISYLHYYQMLFHPWAVGELPRQCQVSTDDLNPLQLIANDVSICKYEDN